MRLLFPASLILRIIIFVIICIAITEFTLRVVWGFCDAVLFREDKNCEYLQLPQNRKRFGNINYYNSKSQRNEEVSDRDSVISFFGDSVINGGVLIDQDSLATTKLSKFFSKKFKRSVKVLNMAAGSWGPDNCFGYLKEYGDFKTNKIVLVVSSHDAYDNMTFRKVVGINHQYPSHQYASSIVELLDRYLLNGHLKPYVTDESLSINKKVDTASFNSGFANFYNYTQEHHIPFLIYLHAEKLELSAKQYNDQGQEIINFCEQRKISLIKELDYNLSSSFYLDEIHFNSQGQNKIFEIMKNALVDK